MATCSLGVTAARSGPIGTGFAGFHPSGFVNGHEETWAMPLKIRVYSDYA